MIFKFSRFTSNGPISFGPTEKWHKIIFFDARNWSDNLFKIYIVDLSNDNNIWQNIKINKKETFHEQCIQKRRPRISWDPLLKQIPTNNNTLIFNGKFSDIFT